MDDAFINPGNAVNKASDNSGKKNPYSSRNARRGGSQSPTKAVDVNKLRIGEVMKGEVLETYGKGIAKVKLPAGILRAQLTDNLRAGDQLMFVVFQVQKGLVLKIHSVASSIQGEHRPIEELIRILNLPSNPFFSKSIQFLRRRRQYIYREECLLLSFLFNKLHPSDFSDIPGKVLFKNLIFFNDHNIEMSRELFNKTKYAFISSNRIEEKLNDLLHNLDSSNYPACEGIHRQMKAIKDNLALQNFFLIKRGTFALEIINLFKQKQNGEIDNLPDEINFLARYINAIEIVRIIQRSSGRPYKIRVPYTEDGRIRIVDILFDIFGKSSRYIFNLSDKYSVQAEINPAATNIMLFARPEDLPHTTEFIEEIIEAFAKQGTNIKIESRELSQLNKYPESEIILLKNRTFVV